jgi:hypothetical protein
MSELILSGLIVLAVIWALVLIPGAYILGVARGSREVFIDEQIVVDTRDTLILGEADQQIAGDDWGRYSRLEVGP